MATRAWLVVFVLAFASSAPAAQECEPVSGAERVVRPGAVILLGEIHGTEQAPAAVAGLACQALSSGLRVSVGLEIPRSEQAVVSDYVLSSSAEDAARLARLKESSFWARDYQDGRSSRAMLDLLRTLKRFRVETDRVRVLLIDDPQAADGRDAHMASVVRDAAASPDADVVVVLVGNLHNRLTAGTSWNPDYQPMGHLLRSMPGLISLQLTHSGGSAWVCSGSDVSDCGSRALEGKEHLPGIMLFAPSSSNAYSGRFHLGPIDASPPAKN